MSLMLELPQEMESALTARAEREGVELPQLIARLLQQGLAIYDGKGDPDGDPLALSRAIAQIRTRSPQEKEDISHRILAQARQPKALPQGKTLSDMVVGKWPGTETEPEIAQLLQELS
jgi:hypothetical protein